MGESVGEGVEPKPCFLMDCFTDHYAINFPHPLPSITDITCRPADGRVTRAVATSSSISPYRVQELSSERAAQWVLLVLLTRRGSYLSFKVFVKNFDHPAGGLSAVRLTSRGIPSLTVLVHCLSFILINSPAHRIIDI
ncbi:unnamed protein product [Angiostrongylus costaricensis]|uniref:Uncharacterized protein n=1 Tax=Angiostrongylus costaricensis TaxID=334426 RepID=A0A0R3PRC1_ANGCS|nr:unnamed protein product [Angiostrongylus costaricensis]